MKSVKLETVTENVIRNILSHIPPIMEERYKMAETNEIDQSEQSTQIESHSKKKKKETKSNIHRVNCINIFDRVII